MKKITIKKFENVCLESNNNQILKESSNLNAIKGGTGGNYDNSQIAKLLKKTP